MTNLISDDVKKDFFIWLANEPPAWMLLETTGKLNSINRQSNEDNLVFVPNPKPTGLISPFHSNVIRRYRIEFNLEEFRRENFSNYPSRLDAIFLFESIEEAIKYSQHQPGHVYGRHLIHVVTENRYTYSKHGVGWITALLANAYNDKPTFDPIATSYWSGETTEDKEIKTKIGKLREPSITEILFEGIIKIPDWTASNKEIPIIDTSNLDFEGS